MFSATMLDFLDAQKVKGKKIETVGLFFEDTIFGADSSNIQRKLAAASLLPTSSTNRTHRR